MWFARLNCVNALLGFKWKFDWIGGQASGDQACSLGPRPLNGVATWQRADHYECGRKRKSCVWRVFQSGSSEIGEVTLVGASSGALIPNMLKILRCVIARRDAGLRRGPASFAQRFTVKMLCKAALGV